MKPFTILIFLILLGIQVNAQRFNAFLAVGANTTDDDLTELGDRQVGTRLGLNIGPGVSIHLNKRLETNLEILYSQNGHYVNPIQVPNVTLNKIMLHFIEVPLTVGYRFNIKKTEGAEFYKRSVTGGITFARLINQKIIGVEGRNVSEGLRFDQENVVLFNFGATSFLNKSFAINAKGVLSTFGEWTIALRLLYFL